jgi:hypothetical protein
MCVCACVRVSENVQISCVQEEGLPPSGTHRNHAPNRASKSLVCLLTPRRSSLAPPNMPQSVLGLVFPNGPMFSRSALGFHTAANPVTLGIPLSSESLSIFTILNETLSDACVCVFCVCSVCVSMCACANARASYNYVFASVCMRAFVCLHSSTRSRNSTSSSYTPRKERGRRPSQGL